LIYLDTSVLVAYYCPEPLSRAAERAARAEVAPSISDLCEVEFASALARKLRQAQISRPDADKIWREFISHTDAQLYTRIPLQREHYQIARDWIARFEGALKALDALHLAIAAVKGLVLVSADRGLVNAAASRGVSARLLNVDQ
jgi:predicted nucleic acid-binding protein